MKHLTLLLSHPREQGASLMPAEFLACEAICVPFGASATIARQQIDRIGIE
ncbi:MAG TPA: hypothetical protein QF604_23275 [Candidatus Latescibacteria bacterium]|nr:hypothetical protein [Candidatus Latescibacterota bacterium]